LCNLT